MSDDKKDNVISLDDAKKQLKNFIENDSDDELDVSLFDDDSALLEEMNEKHAFINSLGGKPMVMSYVYSSLVDREIIEFRSPDSIITQYSNKTIQSGKTAIPLGRWWIQHTKRREFDTVIFDPTKDKIHKNCYNLWEGLTIKPNKGCWKQTLKHIYLILCNGDSVKFKYFIKWLAWLIQNPGERAEVCVVFKGKEGAGKGFIFTQFLKIYGQHAMAISNRNHLTGQFNGHLKQIVFLFADEAYYPGDKEIEGVLKQLITEEQIPVRELYKTLGPSKNCLHIGMASNQEWVIPVGDDSRRYFINAVNDKYAKGQIADNIRQEYFNRIWKEMDRGGREAMLYDLLLMELHDWHPRIDVPKTKEMNRQIVLSMSIIHKVYLNLLEDGIFPGEFLDTNKFIVPAKTLNAYLDDLDPSNTRRLSLRARAEFIKKMGATKIRKAEGVFWIFMGLKQMRLEWNKKFPQIEWENIEDEWIVQKSPY